MKEDKTKAKVKQDFLLLLLREIEQNGNNLKQLALNVKWSKQRLNYHLNRKLKNAGFVIKTQSYPFAIYSLTPLGQRVKQIIEQSEGVKPLWRCHALIVVNSLSFSPLLPDFLYPPVGLLQ